MLPPDPRPVALSPHVLAYRAVASRVVWAEKSPERRPRRPARPDFAVLLQAEFARLAA